MKRDDSVSPFTHIQNAPYDFALAPAASASSVSLWSSASSQHSDDSSLSATTSDSDSCDSYCFSQPLPSSQSSVSSIGSSCEPSKFFDPRPKQCTRPIQVELPQELRQNPRRTYNSATARTGRPPALVRQADRKVGFVDNLVDSSTHIVEAIWPTSSVVARNERGGDAVLSLRTFIQETLRRSRTSYSTLQVALYYLILIKPHVPKHDFTMEQPDDCPAIQAIQCGRRMFLAALILASKYLQDRNYSARAWSKISGLDVREINQNEITFLLAVNWKLHITDETYSRWTECVTKFAPPQPPTGPAAQHLYERLCEEFRIAILTLTPELDNLDGLNAWSSTLPQEAMPRSLFTPPNERNCAFGYEGELASTPKSHGAPAVMEPTPATVYTPGRFAPALGLLPTPRLTPQTGGFSTPAVSAASYLLGKGSMALAMAQVSSATAAQSLDRWSPSAASSPQSYFTRRSSLANSISTASSPESMVSDSSRLSRSSSISSASSVNATSSKLDVLARCRYARLCSERSSLKPAIASVPEDYEVDCLTASPEPYTGPAGKDFYDMALETPLARRQREMNDAARALQDLQRHGASQQATVQVRAGVKRSRAASIDNSLQENVREMLAGRPLSGESTWTNSMIRQRSELALQAPVRPVMQDNFKRLCCSTEAAEPFVMSALHPALGGAGGPGMWGGILP